MRGYESLYNVVDHVKALSVSIFRIRLVCRYALMMQSFLVLLISTAITRSLPTSSRKTTSESFFYSNDGPTTQNIEIGDIIIRVMAQNKWFIICNFIFKPVLINVPEPMLL